MLLLACTTKPAVLQKCCGCSRTMLIVDWCWSHVQCGFLNVCESRAACLLSESSCLIYCCLLLPLCLAAVVKQGQVVEQGRHEDLMGAKGAYWTLVHTQQHGGGMEESDVRPAEDEDGSDSDGVPDLPHRLSNVLEVRQYNMKLVQQYSCNKATWLAVHHSGRVRLAAPLPLPLKPSPRCPHSLAHVGL